jgi:predicted phosphodiesterase
LRQFRRETQLWIQKLLIDPTNGQEWRTIDFDGTLLQHFVFNNSTWTVTGAEGLYKFSLDNLLAEKDILDRRLSVNSSWFYSPPKKQVDLDEIYGRYYWHLYYYYDIMHSFSSLHTIDQDMLNCEPGPAIDLAVILDSIHKITSTGSIIRVIQVGDLYELWMNREWLYLNFPNADDPNNGNPFMLDLLEKILAPRADGFQIRLDSGWYECDSLVLNIATVEDLTKSIADQKERPYIFHQWPIEHLLKRKKTGNNSKGIYENEIKKESLNRCQVQLKERITSVKEFHLPISPTWDENTPRGKALKKLLSDNILKCSNAAPTEYLWNKMILDLFEQVNCIMVYGNHDGYRGDLMLNEKLSKSEQAQDFYCESGIWVEHGHRWDLECRDGVPSGAAVTNLGYFYFRPHILWADNHKNYLFIDRFRTNTIPGCFRWFVAINDKFASIPIEWQQKGVKPFAITVVGHSHTPDLVKIRIKKEV